MIKLRHIFLYLLAISCAGCSVFKPNTNPYDKKYWAAYYHEQLTPGAKLVSAGPNRTLEMVNNQYLVKQYYYDTKTVTTIRYYKDAGLKTQSGPGMDFSDTGIKFFEGNYVNGRLHGKVVTYDSSSGWKKTEGTYNDGVITGPLVYYDSTGLVCSTEYYTHDTLTNKLEIRAADGALKQPENWEPGDGKRPMSATDAKKKYILPSFPCDPSFQTGDNCADNSARRYLAVNVRYPEDAHKLGIRGIARVLVKFDKDGSMLDIKVQRGLCNSIRDECIRVVSGMPKWIPGTVDGEPVLSSRTILIQFGR